MRKCMLKGCPGSYENTETYQAFKDKTGHIFVIDHIPAEVCDHCGDTVYSRQTSEAMDLFKKKPPTSYVPVFNCIDLIQASEEAGERALVKSSV